MLSPTNLYDISTAGGLVVTGWMKASVSLDVLLSVCSDSIELEVSDSDAVFSGDNAKWGDSVVLLSSLLVGPDGATLKESADWITLCCTPESIWLAVSMFVVEPYNMGRKSHTCIHYIICN